MVIGVRITYLDPERNAKVPLIKDTYPLLCSCKHTYYFLRLTGFPGNGARSENNIPGARKKCQMRLIKVLPIHFYAVVNTHIIFFALQVCLEMGLGARIMYPEPERNAKCGSLKFYLSTSVTIVPSKRQKLYGVFAFSNAIGLTLNAPIAKKSSAFLVC